ncbi:MAG: hypothetical protein DRO18_05535 [Thermoprotei archaeon]|nr:MAG: hypothetical protein DRO18_05535 [Thermoprotei archaeon]
MAIKIKFHGRIKDMVGTDELVIKSKDLNTVRDVINELLRRYGERLKNVLRNPDEVLQPRCRVIVLVNGFSVKMLGSLDSPLRGDEEVVVDHIDVMEFFGGG